MSRTPLSLFLAALFALLLTAPGAAHGGKARYTRDNPYTYSMQDPGRARHARVTGTVEKVTQFKLVGTQSQDKETVARLRTRNGQMLNVALGPLKGELNISKGARITVEGTRGRVNGRPILFADRIMQNGKSYRATRPRGQNLGRYQGTITATRPVETRSGQRHLLARIKLNNGKNALVNLGLQQDLDNVGLQNKDVTLLARKVSLQGKPALLARSLRVDGKTYDVDWVRARQSLAANK